MQTRSPEAEQATLYAIVMRSQSDLLIPELTPAMFGGESERAIFIAALNIYERGNSVDFVSVLEALDNEDKSYFSTLMTNSFVSDGTRYVPLLKKYALKRQLLAAAGSISAEAQEMEPEVALERACNSLMALSEPTAKKSVRTVKDIFPEFFEELQRRRASDGGINGLSTGFKALDERLKGLKPHDLVYIAGRPSMGKTTLAMNICEHVAVRENKWVLVFSMEMSAAQLIEKSLCSIGGIPLNDVKSGAAAENEYSSSVVAASALMIGSKLLIDDSPGLTPTDMRARATMAARNYGPISLIMVDYLGLMKGSGDNRTQEIGDCSRSLKRLAKEMNCPVIALAQLNRGVEQRADKRPVLSDLRESGDIEQDADVVLMMYRDDYYHPDSHHKGIAEAITRKFRLGELGTDFLGWEGSMSRFTDLKHQPQASAPQRREKVSGGFSYDD